MSLLRVLVTVHASLPYHRLYFSTLSNDFSFFSISSLIGYHISINLLSLISLSASPTGNVISINVFFFPPLSLSFSDKMRTFSPSHSLTHSLSLSLSSHYLSYINFTLILPLSLSLSLSHTHTHIRNANAIRVQAHDLKQTSLLRTRLPIIHREYNGFGHVPN